MSDEITEQKLRDAGWDVVDCTGGGFGVISNSPVAVLDGYPTRVQHISVSNALFLEQGMFCESGETEWEDCIALPDPKGMSDLMAWCRMLGIGE